MRRFAAIAVLFAVATTLSGTVFAKDDARVEALKTAEHLRVSVDVGLEAGGLGRLQAFDASVIFREDCAGQRCCNCK